MKILFINLPYSGHIIPTLGLVEELKKCNNHVTYLLTEEWQDKILAIGAEFKGYKSHKRLSEQMKNAFEVAKEIVPNYDLIIYEQYFFLGKHLAEMYNKPVVRVFTSFASNEELMKEYIHAGGMFSIFRSKWICKKWTKDVSKGVKLKTNCWLDEIIYNPPYLNLVYTIKELQPFAEDFPDEHFKFIGASIYQRSQLNTFKLPQTNDPLIYISLGTIVNNAKSFYQKCIKAFEHEDVTVIMSIGNSVKMENWGNIPNNFHIYPFAPQLEVLEKADIFITHGGLNSVTESLYFGVPMIVIPFITDQPINAKQIETLNLGKRLEYKTITYKLLRNTTLEVLNNPNIQSNISNIQKQMKASRGNKYGAEIIMEYYNSKFK